MNSIFLLSTLTAWWQGLTRRMQEARRYRHDQQLLSSMSDHQLRDLGLSHAEAATAGRRFFRAQMREGSGTGARAPGLTGPVRASRP
jgi:uncharacterized protein YjiS (DUF1127 family)